MLRRSKRERKQRIFGDHRVGSCLECFGNCTTNEECHRNRWVLSKAQNSANAANNTNTSKRKRSKTHVVHDHECFGHCAPPDECHKKRLASSKGQNDANDANAPTRKQTAREREEPTCSLQSVSILARADTDVSKESSWTQKDPVHDITVVSSVSSQDKHKEMSSSVTNHVCMPCPSIVDLSNKHLLRTDYQSCAAECTSQHD